MVIFTNTTRFQVKIAFEYNITRTDVTGKMFHFAICIAL